MIPLYLILGKSGTGKTYLANKLQWKLAKRYTTREPREDESGTSEYIFLTPKQAFWRLARPKVIGYTVFDGNAYFCTDDQIRVADAHIVDPNGLREFLRLKESLYNPLAERSIISVYLRAPWYRRLYRMVRRDWRSAGMERAIIKAVKRLFHDSRVFDRVEADITIHT